MKRAIALVVMAGLVGCASLKIPAGAPGLPLGADLNAFGKASARMTVGPKLTTTYRDGVEISQVCEEAIGQQCISYEVTGGEFTGWQTMLSIVGAGFTIYNAAN